MPTVQDAVATKVKVGLGTALFLGVATAVTFSIGGAMLAGYLPSSNLSTVCYKEATSTVLYKDVNMTTVATNGCDIVRPTTEKPYRVMNVSNMLNLTPMFDEQKYSLASGDGATNFGSWHAYWYQAADSSAVAVPLRITVSGGSAERSVAADIIYITTSAGKLNVCLPEVLTTKTLYVSVSGTTYEDAGLTKRATSKSCATILANAMTPTQVTGVSSLTMDTAADFSRESYNILAVWWGTYDYPTEFTQADGTKAPLRVGYRPTAYGADPITVQENIFSLTTDIGVLPVCMPKKEFVNSISQAAFLYIAKDGTPYFDALLTKRAIAENCSSILGRAYEPTVIQDNSVTTLHRVYANFSRSYGPYGSLGTFYESGYFQQYGQTANTSRGPLMLTLKPYTTVPNPFPNPFTYPANIFTVTSPEGIQAVCAPEVSIDTSGDPYAGKTYFIGKDGTPYTDALLTKRAIGETCSAVLARAFEPSVVSEAWTIQQAYVNFSRSYGPYGSLGTMYEYMQYQQYSQTPIHSRGPLMVTIKAYGTPPEPFPNPFTYQANIFTLTSTTGLQSVCIPQVSLDTSGDPYAGKTFYISKDGTPFTDALLTKQATSRTCGSVLDQAFAPATVTTASTSVPQQFEHWFLHFNRFSWMELGILFGNGDFHNYNQANLALRTPLQLQYHGNVYDEAYQDLPEHTVTAETNLGSKTICAPTVHVQEDPNGYGAVKYLYVDKNGSTYDDVLLTKLAKGCPTVSDKPITIE